MSWVDITILAVIALFAVFGVLRGVQKSALSLGAFLVAFVVAFFLSKVVAEALLNIEGIKAFVMGDGGWSLYTMLDKGIGSIEPSEFITKNFYEPVLERIGEFAGYNAEFTVADGTALYLAFVLYSGIVGVALFIIARLLLCIVTMIIKSYIPRKKSAGNRACGTLVGLARGAVWALVITFMFGFVGGFSFMGGIAKVETEYENSVVGKYFNSAAYGLRNKLYLPDANMFARIVDKSGLAVIEAEPEEPDPLDGKRNELFVQFMNLNYDSGSGYKIDPETGKIEMLDGPTPLDPAAFAESGFDTVVKAITEYNVKAAESITGDAHSLATADATVLDAYKATLEDGVYVLLYGGDNPLFTVLTNYNNAIVRNKDLENAELIASENAKLAEQYAQITAILDSIKAKFGELGLISDAVGALSLPDYPDCYVIGEADK